MTFKKFSRSGMTLALTFYALSAWSQYISLISPSSSTNVPDGDEFATSVVGMPWNMQNLRRIPYDINFYQPSVENGVWAGTFLSQGGFYYPLNRGFSTPSYNIYFSRFDAGIPYGPLNPLDASKYSRLSFRAAQNNRSYLYFFWYHTYGQTENNYLGFADADGAINDMVEYPDTVRIYDLDMTGKSFYSNRLPGFNGPLAQSGNWTGTLYGFYILPSNLGPAGSQHQVSWIRAYNPATSPIIPVEWATDGLTPGYSFSVQLYVDTDSTGHDGELLQTGINPEAGSYPIYTAAFPPGNYYFYLKLVVAMPYSFMTAAYSKYSSCVHIGSAPTFEFTAPSFTSGTDYATAELGNPWDMNDASDIYSNVNVSGMTFASGLLTATANAPVPPATESDAQLWLSTVKNGQTLPIHSEFYRYLTFRMRVDPTGYINALDRIQRGWVSRWIWAKSDFIVDGSYSKDVPLLEDWHSYTVDLWDNTFLETVGNLSLPQAGWEEISRVNYLRFDPLEVPADTIFQLDEVKLCSYNAPANDTYPLSWVVGDEDSHSVNIALSYGTLNGNLFSGTLITNLTQAPGAGSYQWNTAGLVAGQYYIQAVISDGSHTLTRVSAAPVYVGVNGGFNLHVPNGVPIQRDYDADGKTDPGVYEEATGLWTVLLSASGYAQVTASFGSSGWQACPADFDGDGKADPAIYNRTTGQWSIMMSASGYAQASMTFGASGWACIPADFDGDRKADYAVYHEVSGTWAVLLSGSGYAMASAVFGAAGYTAMPADFDKDGRADPALYCATRDTISVMMSGSGYAPVSASQYGGPGWTPVFADYDGDGKADPCIYYEATGSWVFMLSGSGYSISYRTLGGPGYIPAPADIDGDRKFDPWVYSAATGDWT